MTSINWPGAALWVVGMLALAAGLFRGRPK